MCAIEVSFAGVVTADIGGDDVRRVTDAADGGEGSPFPIESERLSIATPGVRVDGDLDVNAAHSIEDYEEAEVEGFPDSNSGTGDYYVAFRFGGVVFGFGVLAGNLSDRDWWWEYLMGAVKLQEPSDPFTTLVERL